ncbi:prepilin peptidase [Ligilactobacillus salivarius]|uniref:prepilin peptidase n=2 Tax=Ligilactobacillus salivarius TaxID=1624 RepID=UPI000666CDF5|nr:A24 family peptidase [Ligilactobacillus salivarius]MDL1931430.1 prepilin peptidase [Ligilactobacillus salivarius]MDU7058001.1 prepilin peptidase [Ligilactobacillus salivarius]MYU75448.1 prepilin peptidase [Ligilactobacillus salivarius]MYU80612.1 prepilin peptidase [Ligilactobacillus salivarius]MYV07985.1 prepilin peptidase [Ligilactobacillus salivarius]
MIYIFFLLFILGTCLGSFISCVAYRYKLGISIIYPRSFCDNCSQTLQHWQLIPIIGFILQKGKCHFCKQKIPLSSTIIELAIGVIFIFNAIIIANANLIFTLLLVVWLTLISLEDYYTLSVDSITLEYGGLILLIFRFHTVITNLKTNFLIIILFTIILTSCNLLNKFGTADTILIVFSFLLLGFYNTLVVILLSCILGIIPYLIKKDFSASHPFIPYLSLSILIIFYATSIFKIPII